MCRGRVGCPRSNQGALFSDGPAPSNDDYNDDFDGFDEDDINDDDDFADHEHNDDDNDEENYDIDDDDDDVMKL